MRDGRGQVSFRIIHDADRAFLEALYASTRDWEFQLTVWKDDEKADFLKGQFEAQDLHYQRVYPNAIRRIITLDGVDIGRLYVDRQDDNLRIIELTLAPGYQGRGIGTDILRSLLNEAHGGKVPVRLMVEKTNPALRLYLRHGFTQTDDQGQHLALEWRPHTGPREV
ncbi:GNAT family N-acetyltransferase [uncultured Tateyamaria sp.]|uniref:GNAT family N-acetyltransferase n=1 Tax=uncultured Tateyamaria sp. TaxID=455651 RepID=UPI00260375EF|nr:GNAT family N-acetyltransferase [uncultured Tateyamaria sp.]